MVISKFLIQIKAVKPNIIQHQTAWPISIQNGKAKQPVLVTSNFTQGCREENACAFDYTHLS